MAGLPTPHTPLKVDGGNQAIVQRGRGPQWPPDCAQGGSGGSSATARPHTCPLLLRALPTTIHGAQLTKTGPCLLIHTKHLKTHIIAATEGT
jgi:hypothetical protein